MEMLARGKKKWEIYRIPDTFNPGSPLYVTEHFP